MQDERQRIMGDRAMDKTPTITLTHRLHISAITPAYIAPFGQLLRVAQGLVLVWLNGEQHVLGAGERLLLDEEDGWPVEITCLGPQGAIVDLITVN